MAGDVGDARAERMRGLTLVATGEVEFGEAIPTLMYALLMLREEAGRRTVPASVVVSCSSARDAW